MSPEQRDAIVREAEGWLRTPWHHNARVKGAGVDCAQLIIAAYVNAGVIADDIDTGQYSRDWMHHREEERFLAWVRLYLDEVAVPGRGDVAVWRFGRCYSHGGIVVKWPQIIHAYQPERCVTYCDALSGKLAKKDRAVLFFTADRRTQ